ncbi:hypothetical protein BdWA1_002183 [Babesia duncani]|uniref:Uncharacterized protein n=1 Tax=Babesia duncani TaxID=323732 RepID=A0AAD9UMD2_9APIC|nr:hypothetical protein BdWA1_003633 [Babesia duncani]KAK2196934.1 hypothetical protein BdWA1_002183 [Babesia duncani]
MFTNTPESIGHKRYHVCQSAIEYCENADTNLKYILLQTRKELDRAKESYAAKESAATVFSSKFNVNRLGELMQIAKDIIDEKSPNLEELNSIELEAINTSFIPYLRDMRNIERLQKDFNTIMKRINVNAEVYKQYNIERKEILSNLTEPPESKFTR